MESVKAKFTEDIKKESEELFNAACEVDDIANTMTVEILANTISTQVLYELEKFPKETLTLDFVKALEITKDDIIAIIGKEELLKQKCDEVLEDFKSYDEYEKIETKINKKPLKT